MTAKKLRVTNDYEYRSQEEDEEQNETEKTPNKKEPPKTSTNVVAKKI